MFVKNNRGTFISCSIGKKSILLYPAGSVGDTVDVDDSCRGEAPFVALVKSGAISIIGAEQGESEIKKAAEAIDANPVRDKMEMRPAEETTKKDVRLVTCCAVKANGEPCTSKVKVPFGEFNPDVPYFCGTHKKESVDKYERVDGKWVKKQ